MSKPTYIIRTWLALALLLAGSVYVRGQYKGSLLAQESAAAATPTPTPRSEAKAQSGAEAEPSAMPAQDPAAGEPKKPKRGTLIFAPIPIISPALGSGMILGVGYVFKLKQDDKLSPPSTVGLVGAFTSGGTRAGGVAGRFYFGENKYQAAFMLAKGRVEVDFYGVGRVPGRDAVQVPLKGGGTVFFGEFLRNVWKDIFVGPRYQHRSLYTTIDGPQTPGGFEIPDIDLQATTVALGVHVQRDRRDSTFYPTKGSLFDFKADWFDQALGSKREYQQYNVSYNGYRQVGKGQVLAYRASGCAANGSVPFYDLCLYGTSSDLRGYTAGEFQNRKMFATQVEYRRELPKRFGVVAFGGVGGIARQYSDFRMDELLPAAGVGLRFKLDKKHHINYRIDYAVGRGGHTLSIGVGESF